MESPVHEYELLPGNWFAQRRADGSVSLVQKQEGRLASRTISKLLVSPEQWVALVAAMSLRGKAEKTLKEAEDLHTTDGASSAEFAKPDRIVMDSAAGEFPERELLAYVEGIPVVEADDTVVYPELPKYPKKKNKV